MKENYVQPISESFPENMQNLNLTPTNQSPTDVLTQNLQKFRVNPKQVKIFPNFKNETFPFLYLSIIKNNEF